MKFISTITSSGHILFFVLLTILTRLPSSYSTLRITAEITDGGVVTLSDVDGVLSVPSNAQLILNCSSSVDNSVDWVTTASQSPLLTTSTRYIRARISSFSQLNTGVYTCSAGVEVKSMFADITQVSTVANPGQYDVYEGESVTLSACASTYPSLQSDLVVRWSHLGAELSSCNSQGFVGCLDCQIIVTDFSTILNYSFEATSQGYTSTKVLYVTVHKTPAVVEPLPSSTRVLQCRGIGLMCIGIGDSTLSVEWKRGNQVISPGGSYLIDTYTSLNPQDDQYYTTSLLSIRPAGPDEEGGYACSFIGYGGRSSSSSTMLFVIEHLCMQRKVSPNSDQYESIPGNSVQVLKSGQAPYVFLCDGSDVSWYQNDAPVPYDGEDVYQAVQFGGLFIARFSEPSYFFCRSGSSSLQSWIYVTTSNPAVVTRPAGSLYQLMGGNVSIHAFLSLPEGDYALDWFYIVNGVRRNVTEFGWSINQLSEEEENYYEVSIYLSSLQQSHSGDIGVEYRVGGQVASTQLSLFLLPPPELVLSPSNSLSLWEGSDVEVECLLKNDSVPVTMSPQWTGVPTCTPQTEVCSVGQTLHLSNLSLSAEGTYLCAAENEAGQYNASIQVTISPISQQLLLLSVLTQNRSFQVSDAVGSLHLDSPEGSILLSCSLDSSSFSTRYLDVTASWTHNSSLSGVSINGTNLTVDTQSIFSTYYGAFNASFCCLAQLNEFRRTQKCLNVRFDIPSPSPTSTTTTTVPSTVTTHLVIFALVENCSLIPSPDPLTPIMQSLLEVSRAQCACNLSDTELHLSHFSCHTDLIQNSPKHLLTLCGASTHSLYQLLESDSILQLNISVGNTSMVISAVTDSPDDTHCDTSPPTTSAPQPPTSVVELPVWGKVLLYGAFPILLLLLILLVLVILVFICNHLIYGSGSKGKSYTVGEEDREEMTELPDAIQTLVQSDQHLISTQVTLSPSQVPQTFKASSYPAYCADSPPPQELLLRPASSPPKQGEFPVMYSNPLLFDGSGEPYSSTSSFPNFNNNRNYSYSLPHETAGRYPNSLTTHRVSLQWPATAAAMAARTTIRRDPAHSSLPSPLRSARLHSAHRKLSQQKSSANSSYAHHQLRIRHPPPPSSAKNSRYNTPTFDSGVEEMESTHPRSSSASSYSEVSDDLPARARASSLVTAFPQHVRSHSTELERITSLPSLVKNKPAYFSYGTKLELYQTVSKEHQGSQTLV